MAGIRARRQGGSRRPGHRLWSAHWRRAPLSCSLVWLAACSGTSPADPDAAAVDARDQPVVDARPGDARPGDAASGADGSVAPDAAVDAGGDSDAGPPSAGVRLMLHGGGAEDDEVFARFVEATGYGRIVTIGAVQDPGSYPYLLFWDGYFTGLGASSVQTLNTENASEVTTALAMAMADADGIFIRGGNQARYMELWRASPFQEQLVAAWQRGAVIAGSSAGAAVLGRPLYDARIGGVAAYEALLDPYDPYITFAQELIPALSNLITDTHFTERGRLGRLAVFALRAPFTPGLQPLALGIDPRTAVLVYDDGSMEVIGRGSATLLDPRPGPNAIAPGVPPAVNEMRLWQMPAGYRFDIERARAGTDPVLARPTYVVPGPAAPPNLGPWPTAILDGDDLAQRSLGDFQLIGLDGDPDAWRTGGLSLMPGSGAWPGALIVTGLYNDSDYFENHLGGMIWAVAQHPEVVAIGVDIQLRAQGSAPCGLAGRSGGYALVVDAREASHVGVPPAGGWQTAAIENGALRVISSTNPWDCAP